MFQDIKLQNDLRLNSPLLLGLNIIWTPLKHPGRGWQGVQGRGHTQVVLSGSVSSFCLVFAEDAIFITSSLCVHIRVKV